MNAFLSVILTATVWNCVNTASIAEDLHCVDRRYGPCHMALTTQCGELICKEDGTYEAKTCPLLPIIPGTIIFREDLSKPFPECCGKVVKLENGQPWVDEYDGTSFNIGKTN